MSELDLQAPIILSDPVCAPIMSFRFVQILECLLTKYPNNCSHIHQGGKNKVAPTYIDLCVGSNIMPTDNIAAEIGLTNGTLGTVVAFGLSDKATNYTEDLIQPKDFYNIDHTKNPDPIVFVHFKSLPDNIVKNTVIDGTSHEKVLPICVDKDGYNVLRVGNIKYYRWQSSLLLL